MSFPLNDVIEGSSTHSWETIWEGGAERAGSKSKFHENRVPSSAAQLSITVKVQSPFKDVPKRSVNDDPLEAPYIPAGTLVPPVKEISTVDVGVKQYSKPVPGLPLSASSGIPKEVPGSLPSPYWAKYTDWPLGAVSNISKSPM